MLDQRRHLDVRLQRREYRQAGLGGWRGVARPQPEPPVGGTVSLAAASAVVVGASHPDSPGGRNQCQPVVALVGCELSTGTGSLVAFLAFGFALQCPLTELALDVLAHPLSKVFQVIDIRSIFRPLLG